MWCRGYILEQAHIVGIVRISLLTKVYEALLFQALEETIPANVRNSQKKKKIMKSLYWIKKIKLENIHKLGDFSVLKNSN